MNTIKLDKNFINVIPIYQFTKDRSKNAQGIKLGRPPGPGKSKLDKYHPEIEALFEIRSTQKFIANRYDPKEANLNNLAEETQPNT